MDQQQVEPVAHTEPVDARLDQAQGHLGVGRGIDVQHPATLGMREHPHPLERGDARQAAGGLTAASEDHERNRARQRDECDRAVARRVAHEPDRLGRCAGVGESRPEHVVDERRDRRESSRAGAEDARVQALQELPGHIERDTRTRLEVRADHTDRDAASRDRQPVVERPAFDLPFERRQLGEGQQLFAQTRDAAVVEPETVERPGVELARSARHILGVRREDRLPVPGEQLGGAPERSRDGSIGEVWSSRPGCRRLELDEPQ